MHYIDTVKDQVSGVKEQVTDLVGKVAGTVGSRTSAQTLTVAATRERIAAFWRDPASLSQVLGEFGAVSCPEPDRYDWTLRRDGEEIATWHTTLSTDADGLRYTGAAADGVDAQLRIEFAEAPADLGTEVTLRVTAPVPGVLTGAVAFKVLYRARALLQTGELPTLAHNPSARAGAR
ncbi:hypothetical protein [Nocardia farcinica]|uniref:hypothetical protein n=1 Tax=Nocardia farcinica TaxID=37329 RepID=UPI001893D744|nr:hypothetical protein [Nocardia farcinica]MBF6250772.1 hypothetical protein [Nocardia farcinica]